MKVGYPVGATHPRNFYLVSKKADVGWVECSTRLLRGFFEGKPNNKTQGDSFDTNP